MVKLKDGTEKRRSKESKLKKRNAANNQNERASEREESTRENKSAEKEKDRVEAVETRGEDGWEKEAGQETGSGGSGFMPRIDNLDVKSYIRRMCLSVTY